MIITYSNDGNAINQNNELILNDSVIWVDLIDMTSQEEQLVESKLGIDIPSREEMAQIEISNRLYVENNAIYITLVSTKAKGYAISNHLITFILHKNILLTIRYINDFKPFHCFISALRKNINKYTKPKIIFLAILSDIVAELADRIEILGRDIDEVSASIFEHEGSAVKKIGYLDIIKKIGLQGNIISKNQESLLSFGRAINFLQKTLKFDNNTEDLQKLDTILVDVHALNEYTKSLNTELSFLLNASLGMISIEQSNIVRLVSIISVIFLPPTLIASIYGMNFDFMPELKYKISYPIALILILISAWLPYRICKKKKWL